MKSVRMKLIIVLVALILLAVTLSTTASIQYSKENLMEDEKDNAIAQTYRYANEIDVWMTGEVDLVKNVAISLENSPDIDAEMNSTLDGYYAERDELLNLYYGKEEDGEFYQANKDATVPDGYDPRERGWYKSAVEKGETVVTDPYWDVLTNQMCDTICCPVYKDGKLHGVVSIDMTLSTITEITEGISYDTNVYAFLSDSSGNFIYHPNEDYLPTEDNVVAVLDELPGLEEIYTDVGAKVVQTKDYKGTECYFTTAAVGDKGFILGIAVPVANVNKILTTMNTRVLTIEFIVIIF